jgi:hypothetical protein
MRGRPEWPIMPGALVESMSRSLPATDQLDREAESWLW